MAYQQNQPGQQPDFDFNLAGTNDSHFETQQRSTYQGNNVNNRSFVSNSSQSQMMSRGDSRLQHRKDSFANNGGLQSPASSTQGWDLKFPTSSHNLVAAMPAQNHGVRFENNPFVTNDSSNYYSAGACFISSESSTPAYDSMAPKIEEAQFKGMHDQIRQSPSTFSPTQLDSAFNMGGDARPMSPHSAEDWQAMNALERQGRAFPTHMRIASAPKATDYRRRGGGGIRKKNAKIEIPDGRTVDVIEEMIAIEQDESRLRELKCQKRLLRNREAALASRQRKKKHTEDLEVKVDEVDKTMAELRARIDAYTLQLETQDHHIVLLEQDLRASSVALEGVRQEKEHMAIHHAQVTRDLRQRIVFMEESMISPAPAMSAAPSSTGYTEINTEMDHFDLNEGDWANQMTFFDSEADWATLPGNRASQTTIQPRLSSSSSSFAQEQTKANESDQHIPTGVLFMLLLCGAFVAANSSSKAPVIPRMPEEVRAVSDTVLNNLLRDVGSDATPTFATPYSMGYPDTTSRGNPWSSQVPNRSAMAEMHRHLTRPTRNQRVEQMSMLTPEQYNSLTQPHTADPSHQQPPPQKRCLATMLSNMRQNAIPKGSKSDVYTRSILWDTIPEDVMEQFKQVIRESDKTRSSGESSNMGGNHNIPN